MALILKIAFIALLAVGPYNIASDLLYLPGRKVRGLIRHPHGKPSFEEQTAKMLRPVTALIARLLPLSESKRQRYEADCARLSIAVPPQGYMAGLMIQSLRLAALGFMFIPLGIPWLSVPACLMGILAYFQSTSKLRKRVEKLNHAIVADLPRMVGSMECTLGNNRDPIGFFSPYRRVAGKMMGQELDVLLTDLQTGNQELAMHRMERRLQSGNLSALIMVLLDVDRGTDRRTSLAVLFRDIRTKERELTRRRMEKRPGRIKAACLLLTVEMIPMFMAPLVMMIVGTLPGVGF